MPERIDLLASPARVDGGGDLAGGASTPAIEPEYGQFVEAVTLLQELREQGLIEFEYELRDKLFSDPIPRTQLSGEDLIIAAREGIEFKRVGDSNAYQPVLEERRLVLRFLPGADGSAGVARLRSLLRLDPSRTRIDFVSPDDAEVDTLDDAGNLSQIIVDTRSLMGMLYYLSHGVDPVGRSSGSSSMRRIG
jgi:hypothetical protein